MQITRKLYSREFAREAIAIVTLVVSLFALLALATYDPADLGANAYPANLTVENGAGTLGARLATWLYGLFGLGAFLLVVLTLVWSTVYFLRRGLDSLPEKLIGISLLVVATCVLLSLRTEPATFGWSDRTPSYGGLLGDAAASWLRLRFGEAGVYLLVLAVMAISFLLATDLFFYPLLRSAVHRVREWVPTLFPRRSRLVATQGLGGISLRPPAWLLPEEPGDSPAGAPGPVQEPGKPDGDAATALQAEVTRLAVDLEETTATLRELEEQAARERAQRETLERKLTETRARPPRPARRRSPPRRPPPATEPQEEEGDGALEEGQNPGRGRAGPEPTGEDPPLPPLALLDEPEEVDQPGKDSLLREQAAVLIETLRTFKIDCELAGIDQGPVITMFELLLAPGIKVSRLSSLGDNIAMALKAPSVRIVAPIPGKSTVGVEVPNLDRIPVRLREIAAADAFTQHGRGIPLMLGKEATGSPLVTDLTRMPHLLIAGQTGSGKSVCINSLLLSVLLSRKPSEVRLLLIDPKQVELSYYAGIPHLLMPVVSDMKTAARVLEWAVQEMEERYQVLSRVGVRSLVTFNKLGAEKVQERLEAHEDADREYIQRWARRMPYLMIVIDELADLMMVAAKEVESLIIRLAQKSRAVGIHLVLATQRPSVDVITGLIKANIPCRISFQVACKIDSRTILDGVGAEKLVGRGDLLYRAPGSSHLHRAQGAFVADEEVQRVVHHLLDTSAGPTYDGTLLETASSPVGTTEGCVESGKRDPLYDEAVRIILETQRGSVSMLQRKLQIGYTRAAKLIDFMEEDGVVGEANGSKAREITMTLEDWETRRGSPAGGERYSCPEDEPVDPDEELDEELDEDLDEELDEDLDLDDDYENDDLLDDEEEEDV